jgi:hypothetical protein
MDAHQRYPPQLLDELWDWNLLSSLLEVTLWFDLSRLFQETQYGANALHLHTQENYGK